MRMMRRGEDAQLHDAPRRGRASCVGWWFHVWALSGQETTVSAWSILQSDNAHYMFGQNASSSLNLLAATISPSIFLHVGHTILQLAIRPTVSNIGHKMQEPTMWISRCVHEFAMPESLKRYMVAN
jgi:hypothetical protein